MISNVYAIVALRSKICLHVRVEFGPMTRTPDGDVMKDKVSKLTANGGGDLPELCLSGLQVQKRTLSAVRIYILIDMDFNQ